MFATPLTGNEWFVFCLVVGFFLAVAWIFLCFLGNCYVRIFHWIDDGESPIKHNPIEAFVMKILGYKSLPSRNLWKYVRTGTEGNDYDIDEYSSDGGAAWGVPSLILFFSPLVIYLTVILYPVAITLFVIFVFAYMARFARRHHKLFQKHLKDPEAHKRD
jgi:hypothetical protein